MNFYTLKIGNVTRKLPIVSLGPHFKVASFNLLGDQELVDIVARELTKKLKGVEFDYLVGPEVKVVPLLHELSQILKKKRYIVCRKEIHGYMVSPLKSREANGLVINGMDAVLIRNKKVVIVDDVVSTGSTIHSVETLTKLADATVVAKIAVFKQGERLHPKQNDLIYLGDLPVFTS